jgi:hypothetical protein
VIVNDLDVLSAIVSPNEANPPLSVDADAVLPLAIVFECFESVARRNFQVIENFGPVQLSQLPKCRTFNVHPALHPLAFEECLRIAALEALDRHV